MPETVAFFLDCGILLLEIAVPLVVEGVEARAFAFAPVAGIFCLYIV